MEGGVEIGDLSDAALLREINNAAVPDVNSMGDAKAAWLVANACLARVAAVDGRAAGVLIVLDEAARLDSEYLKWFTDRYSRFIYIDRVIVAAWARRLGVASRLYAEVDAAARARQVAIASDVYCQPPNVASLAFHARAGYREVGQQLSHAEGKTVSKLLKYSENIVSK